MGAHWHPRSWLPRSWLPVLRPSPPPPRLALHSTGVRSPLNPGAGASLPLSPRLDGPPSQPIVQEGRCAHTPATTPQRGPPRIFALSSFLRHVLPPFPLRPRRATSVNLTSRSAGILLVARSRRSLALLGSRGVSPREATTALFTAHRPTHISLPLCRVTSRTVSSSLHVCCPLGQALGTHNSTFVSWRRRVSNLSRSLSKSCGSRPQRGPPLSGAAAAPGWPGPGRLHHSLPPLAGCSGL